MYLGEIVRLITLSLIDAAPKPILFSGRSSDVLNKLYGVDTAFMSAVEAAWIGEDNKDDFELPALASIDEKNVSAEVKPKLEKIKKLIVDELHISAEHVSLRDAAVSQCSSFHKLGSFPRSRSSAESAISSLVEVASSVVLPSPLSCSLPITARNTPTIPLVLA
jgi:Hexokinase